MALKIFKAPGWLSEQLLTQELELQRPVSVAKLGTQWVIVATIKPGQNKTKQTRQQVVFNFKSQVDKRAE